MTIDLSCILIFKTNISSQAAKAKVLTLLNSYESIEQSSIDLDDVDNVLRIVTVRYSAAQIISIINASGFDCSELE